MSAPATHGPWSPLGQPTFRALWLAILVGNIGTWIHDVAAAWVMAETTNSPLMVAAVQSATTLPVVLLAIIAGTLADIVDRRRYLILAQLWMLLVASTLAVLAHLDRLGPWTLVTLTFALGIGAAMAMPAQQATTPELVPKPMLGPAVALGSLSMNIARAIGPALGGLIVAQAGIAWAFAVNALTFLGVAVVLWRWRRVPVATALPPETFGVALRAGLRYAMQASAGTYGLLLGCIGAGAIAGAMVLPGLRTRLDPDRLVLAATLAYAGCTLGVALLRWIHLLYAVALLAGFAWIAVLSSLQIAAQTAVPAWVRARALSLYIVVFSAGSLGWGAAAQAFGTPAALAAAAVGTALAALFGLRFRLGEAARVNVTPSGHWPQPIVSPELEDERGPVLVTVEYRIDPARRTTFLQRVQPLGRARRRNGALQWGVAEDSTQPGVYLEYFVDASWREHLRQHERVTEDERAIQDALLETLADPAQRPLVRHFIGGAPGVAPPSAAPAQGCLA